MKTTVLSLTIILCYAINYNVKAQGDFYGDSQPALFLIGNNISINTTPPAVYIKKYVEQNIAEWQKKGEYEKTSEYQKRVNEQTRGLKAQQLADEAVKELKKDYAKTINWKDCQISQYDADNETYLIKSLQLGDFAIQVSIPDAPSFKQNWASMQCISTDFFINENSLALAKVTFKNPATGKVFAYDSKQSTTYASNNITYNFKPIEYDVAQDNSTQNNSKIENKTTVIGTADVDVNIPSNSQINDKTFAVIIANENYTREVKVEFANNDGKVFKDYCEKTLGIPSKNIHFSKDATYGTMKSEIKWISDVTAAYNGQAKIIFYYAGHGMPNEADKSAYLLPTDGFSTDYETAIKLDDLYSRLSANPAQSVTVFLDACFSGSLRDNGMLASARGVKIKPKVNSISNNMVVCSAATGDETAYPYKEKQHGLFTYFLLKKLQETKGNVSLQELSNFIIENVKQQSIVVNQKSQTPQVNTSSEMQNIWQNLKLK